MATATSSVRMSITSAGTEPGTTASGGIQAGVSGDGLVRAAVAARATSSEAGGLDRFGAANGR